MTEPPYDPVHKTQYRFERDGENLIVDSLMDPGGHLPEHLHPIQEEHWSVVDGRVKIQLDGEWREIGPEDGAVIVKPGHKHAVKAVLDRQVRLRCHVYPALSLEEFLTDASAAAQEGLISKGGLPKGLKGARWGAKFMKRHRGETVMTFPPQFMQSALIALLARD